jgi:hypothetical protein
LATDNSADFQVDCNFTPASYSSLHRLTSN